MSIETPRNDPTRIEPCVSDASDTLDGEASADGDAFCIVNPCWFHQVSVSIPSAPYSLVCSWRGYQTIERHVPIQRAC